MSTTSRSSIFQKLSISYEKCTELIFSISAVFGISPIFFVNGKPRKSYFIAIYSIFFISIYIYVNISYVFSVRIDYAVPFHRNVFLVSYLLSLLQPVVYFCTNFLSFQRLSNIRQCLRTVDSSLQSFGISEDAHHGLLNGKLYLLLLLSKCSLLFIPKTAGETKIFLLLNVIYLLGCGQCTALGEELGSRLRRILHCLRSMGEQPDQTIGRAERLSLLCKAHHQLCSAIEEFSCCYGFQMLNIVVIQFLSLTITIFSYVWARLSFLKLCMGVLLHSSIPFFTIAIDCWTNVSEMSKEFNVLLYQIMIKDKSKALLDSEKLQLHIAVKREVVLTACGLFNLDYTLLYSMVAAVSTYTVVMFQFA
ncbi:unnamed protein product [Nezara viridula]|uniref:Gustatory receptor n=1 Tax=Nezara viridula TaxID=85310 RepID=A0A9P0H6L1_NEZVI|nr:unnamed protein product [Nezara viridula]